MEHVEGATSEDPISVTPGHFVGLTMKILHFLLLLVLLVVFLIRYTHIFIVLIDNLSHVTHIFIFIVLIDTLSHVTCHMLCAMCKVSHVMGATQSSVNSVVIN